MRHIGWAGRKQFSFECWRCRCRCFTNSTAIPHFHSPSLVTKATTITTSTAEKKQPNSDATSLITWLLTSGRCSSSFSITHFKPCSQKVYLLFHNWNASLYGTKAANVLGRTKKHAKKGERTSVCAYACTECYYPVEVFPNCFQRHFASLFDRFPRKAHILKICKRKEMENTQATQQRRREKNLDCTSNSTKT